MQETKRVTVVLKLTRETRGNSEQVRDIVA